MIVILYFCGVEWIFYEHTVVGITEVFVSALPSVILDPPLIGERYTVEQGRRADLLCARNNQDYPLPSNITINGSK